MYALPAGASGWNATTSVLPLANGATLFSVSWHDGLMFAIGRSCSGPNGTVSSSISILESTDDGQSWNAESSNPDTPSNVRASAALRGRGDVSSGSNMLAAHSLAPLTSTLWGAGPALIPVGSPVIETSGRAWIAMASDAPTEQAVADSEPQYRASTQSCVALASVPQGSDVTDPTQWSVSTPVCFNSSWVPKDWIPPASPALLHPNAVQLPPSMGAGVGILAGVTSWPEPGNHAALFVPSGPSSVTSGTRSDSSSHGTEGLSAGATKDYDGAAPFDLKFYGFVNVPGGHAPFNLLQRETAGLPWRCTGDKSSYGTIGNATYAIASAVSLDI